MFSKIVLCAFPNRMTAGLWRMGRVVSCESFSNDGMGQDNFRQFLHQHKNVPIYLIADAVEEDYRLETLPHATGNERRMLVERRLNQLYRNVAYRAAYHVGRERDKRKDDISLFVALNNADCIKPWVLAIEEQRAPLAGVYLLPMVSQFLVDRLKLAAPHMLLTHLQPSGLRQTYFHDGKLRVSRQAPIDNVPEGQMAKLFATETEKTRLYLLSQHLVGRDTKLSLLVLSSGEEGDEICRQIGAEQGIECLALDSTKLAGVIGLSPHALRQFPELLYMQMAARGGISVNLAPTAQTKGYFIHRLRGLIGVTSAALLAGGLTVSATSFFHTMDYKAQLDAARIQTVAQERKYHEVARNFPVTPLPGEDLKIAVEISRTIAASAQTPQRLMLVTSSVLDQAPEIQLQRLRWKLTEDLNFKDEGASQQSGISTSAAASSPAPVAGGSAGTLYEIGFLDGEIRNFTGDYRAALESVNRVADLLRKDARVEQVVVVQQPVNVSSYTNLQGSTLDAQAQQMPAAQFKLKVILKPAMARS